MTEPSPAGASGQEAELERLRRRVEELESSVRGYEARFGSLFRHTGTPLVVLDDDGTVRECSQRFQELSGLSRGELVDRENWQRFVAEEDLQRLRGYFRERGRDPSRVPSTYSFRFVSADGRSTYVQANVGMIPGTRERIVALTDLSEVVRAQHRTAESEERYRAVVENTRDGIIISRGGRVHFVNSTFCEMTGYSREDIYAMNPLELFVPGDRAAVMEVTEAISEGNRHTGLLEAGVLARSGEFIGELSSVAIRYRGSGAVLTAIRDISQRRRAEREQRESLKLLRTIVDSSPVGISVRDSRGTLLMANAAWRSIWSKTEDAQRELMFEREQLRLDRRDDYLGEHREGVERVYREGGEYHIPRLRIPQPAPDGAEWIAQHFYAIEDESGAVDKVIVLTLDLTEILRTRERLQQSIEQYRELADNVPVAVYRSSVVGDGRIISCNPETYRLLRIESPEQMEQLTVSSLYVDSSDREKLLGKLRAEEDVDSFETELRRPDGSTFLASLSSRAVRDEEGRIRYIEGIIRDVTETRRAERELQQAANLESLGILAGGIAHDFNNILTGIAGNISLALEELDGGGRVDREHLERAERATGEAETLTRQLLTFSAGGAPVKESLELPGMLREVVEFVLRGSNVRAEFDVPDDLPQVEADFVQVYRALQNILMNARQFMPEGGTVSVSAEPLELGGGDVPGLEAGRYVVIGIADEGPGIPEEDRGRVFNPYYTTRPGGSGLGLAMSYSVISRHGGTIRIGSGGGGGALMSVYLPVGSVRPPETLPETPDGLDPSQVNVLVMDDEPLVREVLTGMLEQLGYRYRACADGAEALSEYDRAMADGEPYDVVIMDLTVPGGMGGVETLARLRERESGVRTIVTSGYSGDAVMSDYREHGFSGRLPKPFRIATLRRVMARVMTE